jgi:hypothetical protein
MIHLICFLVSLFLHVRQPYRTFCLRHDAHALTLRDTSGVEALSAASDGRGREAGEAEFGSASTCDQVRFAGILCSQLAYTLS